MGLGTAIIWATLSSGLIIEAGAPDSLCPALAQTQAAVGARLGHVDASAGGPWTARYTIVHSPDGSKGDYIRLELRDPAGELKLARELPMAGESCTTMAQAIALVLERYFRDLGETESAAQPDVKSPVDEEPSAPQPSATAPPAPAPASTDAAELPARSLVIGVRGGAATAPSGGAVGPALRVRVAEQFHVGAHVLWLFGVDEETPDFGTLQTEAELRALATRAWFGYERAFGALVLFAGPELLVLLEQGSSDSPSQPNRPTLESPAYRLRPGAGLRVGVAAWLVPWLAITLEGSADVSLPTREFVLESQTDRQQVLKPSIFQGFVGIGLDVALD